MGEPYNSPYYGGGGGPGGMYGDDHHHRHHHHGVMEPDFEHGGSGGGAGGIGGGGSGKGNVYTVEHLATFGLSEELSYPEDGMRRLLHMEKAGFGIWSQKMRIRLESNYIVILDYENGNEMERFPLQLIRHPTPFTNANPQELYNNVVAFVVHPDEMHIFQCFNISATDLVEDIKLALGGRMPPQRTRHGSQNSLPPPPVNPPPEPPSFPPVMGKPGNDDVRDEDTSSVGSDGHYDREVNILNRCFDDIERFIARLQYAAAAYKELQRRRKTKKSKNKDHGEGLLSLRARPPHEKEFMDILQKFKLSFNLLARLKAHIHDPNAPELVHFLFTPLALIVDASRDAYRPGLAGQVVAPLLSPGAIELLNNCLSSKENELWHSLGEAWLVPRDQWKSYVAPYKPVFSDGWSPPVPDSSGITSVASEFKKRLQAQQHASSVEREGSVSPVDMLGDDFNAGQRAFMDSVRSRNGRLVVATHHRTANNHKELTVVRGEYLEVLDDTKKWWKARNYKGQVAHVPHTIVAQPNEFHDAPAGYHGGKWQSAPSSISSDDHPGNQRGAIPPPPPPQPVENRTSPVRTMTQPRKDLQPNDVVQDELKVVLSHFQKKPMIDIQSTPKVFISQDSSVSEVHNWLKVKGFSERVVRTLTGMNGNELFKMNRTQLENYCGKIEGRRLDSQITVSRNVSGFKTMRSTELRKVLEKARQRTDGEKNAAKNTTFYSDDDDDDDDDDLGFDKILKEEASREASRESSPWPKVNGSSPKPPPAAPTPPPAFAKNMRAVKKVQKFKEDSEDDSDYGDMDGKSTFSKLIAAKSKKIGSLKRN